MKKLKFTLLLALTMFLILPTNVQANPLAVENQTKELNYEDESCLALNYHRVRDFNLFETIIMFLSNDRELSTYSVSTDAFREQMEWLVDKNATFLTAEALLESYESGDFPERCVWVNFDDMDQTIYDNAHPVLVEHNIPATGFVITGEVGNENFNNLKLLDEETLLEMEATNLWELETHTHKFHHLDGDNSMILGQSVPSIHTDLTDSLNYLNRTFDCLCNNIAYPYGQSNDKVVDVLGEVGIEYGFTLEESVITPDSNPYYLPRVLVSESAFERLVKEWKGFN